MVFILETKQNGAKVHISVKVQSFAVVYALARFYKSSITWRVS